MRPIVLVLAALVAVPLAGAAGAAGNVHILNFKFVDSSTGQADTVITVGGTVTWQWMGGAVPHSATQDTTVSTSSSTFDSGIKTVGTFTVTFAEPGVFAYHCKVHPSMTGTILVV